MRILRIDIDWPKRKATVTKLCEGRSYVAQCFDKGSKMELVIDSKPKRTAKGKE